MGLHATRGLGVFWAVNVIQLSCLLICRLFPPAWVVELFHMQVSRIDLLEDVSKMSLTCQTSIGASLNLF